MNNSWEDNRPYHPYKYEIEDFMQKYDIKELMKDWDEKIKNVFFGYVLTNPFGFSWEVEMSYLYIFNNAISVVKFCNKENPYSINKEDLLNQLRKEMIKDEDDNQEYHTWLVLNELLRQKLL